MGDTDTVEGTQQTGGTPMASQQRGESVDAVIFITCHYEQFPSNGNIYKCG